jgi:hypothetical protein
MENLIKVQCPIQCRMDILSWTMLCNSLLNMSHNKILTYTWPLPKMQLQFRAPYCYILSKPIWFATTIMSTQSVWQFSSPLYHVICNTHQGGGGENIWTSSITKYMPVSLSHFPFCPTYAQLHDHRHQQILMPIPQKLYTIVCILLETMTFFF